MAHEISPQSGKTGRPGDPVIVNGKPLTVKETQEHQQQQVQEHEQVKQRAEALAHNLSQTYEELTRLLERNPGVKLQITEGEAREDKVYQKLKQRLKLADIAPRCRWVRQDGTSCRSPQMKQHIYCFAHMQMAEARTLLLMLPPPEDANAIQVGLMRIQKALIEDTISTKKAGLLLYSMQLAVTNVGQTTFGQAKDEEMVRDTVGEEEAFSEEALSSQHSAVSEKQNQHQHQRPFTTEDTEDTEEEKGLPRNQNLFTTEGTEDTEKNQGLPLMNTDDTEFGEAGGEDGSRDVEFVPVPGGHGFERVRLRIEPELGGQRRLVQSVIAPKDSAEVRANLG
ncbi:MAG TPA: hypothetical protein VGQ12_09295 [Candidatus Angelobacter sp.]|jgi:hypothetical protein|nr:hypothetical protein [Candidatus Angelobacter sp.]